jgi:hypothetical protein
VENLSVIKQIGFLESGTSYVVQINDIVNNKIICEMTFDNKLEEVGDVGYLRNLPTTSSIFEIRAKVNQKSVAHILNINLCYS